ncbi:MAG TPA: hypothetical protein VKU00_05870 [Chthonomonadaceae bacterium]|nr:hypothetical protein [Chthonomonadaceae bacterium]
MACSSASSGNFRSDHISLLRNLAFLKHRCLIPGEQATLIEERLNLPIQLPH